MRDNKNKDFKTLLDKVAQISKEKKLDLSSGEDLSIGVMNLISAEEHLFYTYGKTKDKKYISLLNEVRLLRTDLLKDLIKDYEGEVWCISKHLLSASMRVMEVGTKYLKQGKENEAKEMFDKSYKLYLLFWGIILDKKDMGLKREDEDVNFINDKTGKITKASVLQKLDIFLKKALDCCKE